MKKWAPNPNKWQFSVHKEHGSNWFRCKGKFIFLKWMEIIKWDEFFVLEGLLSTQKNWSLIDLHQLQRVWMRCTSNTDPVWIWPSCRSQGKLGFSSQACHPVSTFFWKARSFLKLLFFSPVLGQFDFKLSGIDTALKPTHRLKKIPNFS